MLLSNVFFSTGLVCRDKGEIDLAEDAFLNAIDTVESTREKIIGNEKINYFATIQDFYDEIILLYYNQSKDESAFDFSERSRARAFLDLFQTDAGIDFGNNGERKRPPSCNEIQPSLPANIQIVEYKVTNNKLIIFLLGKHRLLIKETCISREELGELISEFRKKIGADNYSAFLNAIKKEPEQVFQDFAQLSEKLYSIAIEPIEQEILADKIIYIIPDDVLYYLPFPALVFKKNYPPQFLINKNTIVHIPSAAILKYSLETRKKHVPNDQMKFFAIGNPVLDLPFSEKEVRSISQMFSFSETLVGSQVSEDTVVDCINRGFDVVHLATHAIINEREPFYSYLTLGGKANLNPEAYRSRSSDLRVTYDDLLMSHEVINLNLFNTSLVSLSACKTAGGRLFRGEGIVGLTSAFMKAGASSVITSLWNVDDKYTERFMTAFYNHWIKQGEIKSVAFRKAQIEMINEMHKNEFIKLPHPYYWAAFTLIGEF